MVLAARRWTAAWRFRILRRRCAGRLAQLSLTPTTSMAALCEQLGRRRDRPIRLVSLPMPEAGPCGIWLSLPEVDLIAYEAGTHRMHQDHIIAHELAHLICGHSTVDNRPGLDTRALFPDLDPALVRALLHRAHYPDAQEQEAEVMASLLLSRLSRPSPEPSGGNELTLRLEQALLPPHRRGRPPDA
ncbi:hypothetical protein [Krasilnikovia sp. MM14-A1259]|uniref:hypothetical protein n=1 Tax=Krasilnikovia sp. MM14-A1259 TaxID=3373539 RepID=UPI00381EBD92